MDDVVESPLLYKSLGSGRMEELLVSHHHDSCLHWISILRLMEESSAGLAGPQDCVC